MALKRLGWWLARPEMWEREIRAFERRERTSRTEPGRIVFTGSSSIRFWSTLEEDMWPLAVVNRGFGGAHAAHVTHYAERILLPTAPRAVVMYAGDNDLGRLSPRSTRSVVADFEAFVIAIRKRLGETLPIYLLSIKPSPLRAKQWPRMARTNEGIARIAAEMSNVAYLDVATPMLDGRGRPRRELYRWDGLHMNAAGYGLWTSIVKPRLLEDFGSSSRSSRS